LVMDNRSAFEDLDAAAISKECADPLSIGSKTELMRGIVLITLMEETEPTVVMVLSKLTPRL
jgi:hypothetical protein